MNLSSREAVGALGHQIFGLIFENGGFEEMVEASGFGMMAKAAKPIVMRKAAASIQSITDEQAAWLIDQVHQLSAQFEDLTGNHSAYHYGEDKAA